MKTHLLSLFFIIIAFGVSLGQTFEWAKQMGGTSGDIGRSIVVGKNGNVYTTGYFQGKADFDTGADTFYLTSNGAYDIFISKLDKNGNLLWVKQMGGTFYDSGSSIFVDSSENVYITGAFNDIVDFDTGLGALYLTSIGYNDVFISKLDSLGNFLWVKQFGGENNEGGVSIAVDASKNVLITGNFSGTTDFNPDAETYNLTSFDSSDIFISKIDSLGNFLWAKQIGGTGNENGNFITVDNSNNIFTIGRFTGTADFNPSANTYNLTSIGSSDIFISKLDSLGNFLWAKKIGGIGADEGRSIVIDSSSNIYITGYFYGTVDFNPGTGIFNLTSVGASDIFISKLNSNGNFIWAKKIGGVNYDFGYSIGLDGLGDVYTTGSFAETVDFNPGSGVFNLISIGVFDLFISKLNSSGNFIWANQIGGLNYEIGNAIVLDVSGNIYITGNFSGTTDFDIGTGTFDLMSNGSNDIFVCKLKQIDSTVFIESIYENLIKIYPNPATNEVFIEVPNNKQQTTNNKQFKLFSIDGKKLLEGKLESSKTRISTKDLEGGVYFIEVSLGCEKVNSKLVITK